MCWRRWHWAVMLKMPLEGLIEGAKRYRGLPHRCQLISQLNGVRFIDDSKGTNIGATAAALEVWPARDKSG